jgi:thiol-disulfide isomerase/thioredoxin
LDELTKRSCPHCGAEVPALPECLRCGIVFAKYRPRPSPTRTGEVTASRPDSRPLAPWLAVLALVSVVAWVISRGGDQPQPAAIPPQTVAPQPISDPAQEPTSEAAQEPASPAGLWNQDDDFGFEAEPDPEPRTASAADFEALASVGYDWFENASGFRSGLELAAAESRPIAVYFYTDWCGYCRQFERELLTRARVEDFTKYLVKVRINPESGRQEREIARQYGVRGYPSFFVQASVDARPRKIRQHKRVGSDWVLRTPSDFVTTLRRTIG